MLEQYLIAKSYSRRNNVLRNQYTTIIYQGPDGPYTLVNHQSTYPRRATRFLLRRRL